MIAAARRRFLHGTWLLGLAAALAWSCAEGSTGRNSGGDDDGGNGGEAGSGIGAAGGAGTTTTTTSSGTGAGPGDCGVVVNEVQVASPSAASDEFVEIYNACGSSVDLTGWRLVYRSSDGTTDNSLYTWSAGSIAAHGYLLVVGQAWSGGATPDGTIGSGGLAADGGGVGLRDASDALVDSVGYGDATNEFVEHVAAAAPPEGSSIGRSPDGADLDNNATDFVLLGAPSPKAANAP